MQEQNGMILVPAGQVRIGTTKEERQALGERFDCHPTWLNDDFARQEVDLPLLVISGLSMLAASLMVAVTLWAWAPLTDPLSNLFCSLTLVMR